MVGWTVSKALMRTGVPALGLFVAKLWLDLANNEAGAPWAEIVSSNALIFLFLWLGVAELVYVLTRVIRPVSRVGASTRHDLND